MSTLSIGPSPSRGGGFEELDEAESEGASTVIPMGIFPNPLVESCLSCRYFLNFGVFGGFAAGASAQGSVLDLMMMGLCFGTPRVVLLLVGVSGFGGGGGAAILGAPLSWFGSEIEIAAFPGCFLLPNLPNNLHPLFFCSALGF